MHRAEKPTKLLLIVQVFQTGVGLARGRHVDQSEADAGHDLDHEAQQSAAAEDVEPTARSARDVMACGRSEDLADIDSIVYPDCELSQSLNHFVLMTRSLPLPLLTSCRLIQGRKLAAVYP